MRYTQFKFVLLPIIALLIFIPAVPRAHALLDQLLGGLTGGGGGLQRVIVEGNISEPAITTALQAVKSVFLGGEQLAALDWQRLKEEVLDPAAWGAAKQFQQQLTGEMLKWLGGQQPGQDGQVPFVQDIGLHYQEISDGIAGEFIFGSELTGRCSEEEDFKVRQKVYENFVQNRYGNTGNGGGLFQCPNGEEGGESSLTAILKNTINCDGDSVCAVYKAERQLAEQQLNALTNEKQLLDYTRGMLPQRICKVVNDPDGRPRQLCEITSPPSVAADAVSFNLVDLPGLQMLNMDEFGEIASNLMNNLTNLVTQGFSGVLGLSGNPGYSQNVFGPDGSLSYVEALVQDDISVYQSGGGDYLAKALAVEQKYASLQKFILDEIKKLEDKLAANEQEFAGCFDLELSNQLKGAKYGIPNPQTEIDYGALYNFSKASTTIAILTGLQQQYDSGDANIRNSIAVTYNQYRSQGLFHTEFQNRALEIDYIDLDFAQMVDKFKYDTAVERQSCGGSFDYEGVLTS